MPTKRGKGRRPVLIIPGFMSSGLEVVKSPTKSWEGKRIWLNLTQVGFQSLNARGALRKNEEARSVRDLSTDPSSEQMHQEYLRQIECKSKWVRHMRLRSNLIQEREGVEVRPIQGTSGVDYLSPGALTESLSYVFGPVLNILKENGYVDGVTLDAAPYDWRLPPSQLEKRDSYFTNTMQLIEKLYRSSDGSPVVLLCHSMGCKTAHYLLNFVVQLLGDEEGRKWIDKNIYAYVPVGAPHLGAGKSFRSLLTGDKMGLEAFLSDDEGLALNRSIGSVPWLFPQTCVEALSREIMPQSKPDQMQIPTVTLKEESTLRVSLPAQTLHLHSLHNNAEGIKKVRLSIEVGDGVFLRMGYIDVGDEAKAVLHEESWLLACPPSLDAAIQRYPSIRFHLDEPGAGLGDDKKRNHLCHLDICLPFRLICCLMKWILCCPCSMVWKMGRGVAKVSKRAADAGAKALGAYTVIAQSGKVDWKRGIIEQRPDNVDIEHGNLYEINARLHSTDNQRVGLFSAKKPGQLVTIKIKWEPSVSFENRHRSGIVEHKRDPSSCYNTCSSEHVMKLEGLTNHLGLLNQAYLSDPIKPLSSSSVDPPPVKRVIAIYGTNLDTEVAGAYCRNPVVKLSSSDNKFMIKPLHILDENAKLTRIGGQTHVIKKGIISETSKTPQRIVGGDPSKRVNTSGDGTVPYRSLQHSRSWKGKGCDVTVHEIDKAEHREILNDERFHRLVLGIVQYDIAKVH